MILVASVVATVACLAGLVEVGGFTGLVVVAFVVGGMANPIYAMLLAYTNDYLAPEDMAAASARLLFINGAAATLGPIGTGWLIGVMGPGGSSSISAR